MAGAPADSVMTGAMDAMRMQLENHRAFQAGAQADMAANLATAQFMNNAGGQAGQVDPAVFAALFGGGNPGMQGPPPGLVPPANLPPLGSTMPGIAPGLLPGGGMPPAAPPLANLAPSPGPPPGPMMAGVTGVGGSSGSFRPQGGGAAGGGKGHHHQRMQNQSHQQHQQQQQQPPQQQQQHHQQQQRMVETPAQTSAREAAAAAKQHKEDKEREKAALREEAAKVKCHLHQKPKSGCKFCKRFQDAQAKADEKDEAVPEGRIGLSGGATSYEDIRNGRVPVEIVNTKTYGFSPLLQSHITESKHFKELMNFTSFEQLLQETFDYADSVEPYMGGTVGSTTPSSLFCCLYRLFTIGLDSRQLCRLIENVNSPYIRCMGFLFIRFGLPADQLWLWLGEFVLDTEELRPTKGSAVQKTVGEYVEDLLSEEKYYSTPLPRIPNSAKRQLEAKLAPVPQYRKRARANLDLLDVYRKRSVQIQANPSGEWIPGTTTELIDDAPSRIKVRVQLEGHGEEVVPLGKVILTDQRYSNYGAQSAKQDRAERGASGSGRGRSRSRSPHIDWAREKGRSDQELIDEMRSRDRERAVASGKDYAKKPVGFKKACALPREQGVASYRLMEEETYVSDRPQRRRTPSPQRQQSQRSAPSAEHQARMQQLFEKYGMAKSQAADSSGRGDIEDSAVLRFG